MGEVKGFDIGAEEREEKRESIFSAVSPSPLPILEFAHEQEIQAGYVHCIFKQTNSALFSPPFSFFSCTSILSHSNGRRRDV